MTRHVSTDKLARHREGAVGRREAARIFAHLQACARCAKINSDLGAISTMLANVKVPSIPDHLAARLQSALESEASARASLQASEVARKAQSGTVRAGLAERKGPRGRGRRERAGQSRLLRMPRLPATLALRTVAVAAAVLIVAGGGYLAVSRIVAATSGPPTAGGVGYPASSGGNTRPKPNGAERKLATRLKPVNFVPYTEHGRTSDAPAIVSNTDYNRATFAAQIRAKVTFGFLTVNGRVRATHAPTPTATVAQVDGLSLQRLEGCVSRVASGRDVLLVDLARYERSPATVIVTARSASARLLYVVVVGRACSTTFADVIAKFTVPPG